jgi:hypothetical protein
MGSDEAVDGEEEVAMGRLRWIGLVSLAIGFTGTGSAVGEAARSAPPEPLRMPVRSGTVVVKVANYEIARRQVLDAALQQGAELLNSRTDVDEKGRKHGWARLRIPAEQLPELLSAVNRAGKLYAENIVTKDHASEYEELERRVGRLREHQTRLAAVLASKRRLRGSDLLYIQERLFRAGVDEGMLLQRRLNLERMARASTLVVQLFEVEPGRLTDLGNWYAGASLRAHESFRRYLAHWVSGGAFAVAYAPLWIPLLILALLLARWVWRSGIFSRGAALVARLASTIAARSAHGGLPPSASGLSGGNRAS